MADIQWDDDTEPMRDYLHSGREIGKLNVLLLSNTILTVDRIDRRPNGELNLISFRELAAHSILEWLSKLPARKFRKVHITNVLRSTENSIRYQVDFSLIDQNASGNYEYLVLRIFQILDNRFRVVIQNKGSASSTPFGVSASDPSTVWLRDMAINEALYSERQLKLWKL